MFKIPQNTIKIQALICTQSRNNKIKKDKELPKQVLKNVDNKKIPQTEKKNQKLEEKTIPQDEKEKSPHRQSSRLRNQPRNDYKTFIPQSKTLKKNEFQKPL